MKLIKDKQILVAADKAGFPLKEAVVRHLKQQGWTVTDIGVQSADDPNPEMFHQGLELLPGRKLRRRNLNGRCCFAAQEWGFTLPPANVRVSWPVLWKTCLPRCGRLRATM